MRTLFCILSTAAYKNTRQKSLRETWLRGQEFFFASDEDGDSSVRLSFRSDYRSAEDKQINALKYISENRRGYDRVFFCDDDTFINVRNIGDRVNCGSVLSKESDPMNPLFKRMPDFSYYSGGAGFILDMETVVRLSRLVPDFKSGYGDVTVGILMRHLGIKANNDPLFFKDSPEKFGHGDDMIRRAISYHYIKPENMAVLHRKFLDLPPATPTLAP